MTVHQTSLFDAPATRGASRRNGPATSREAARSVSGHVLRAQQALVLSGVGHLGSTAYEVWLRLRDQGPQQNVIARRLFELREMGLLELTGETRAGSSFRQLQVHRLTEKGREHMRSVA